MPGSMSDTFEKAILNYIFRSTPLGLDTTNVWIALFSVAPTDSTTGTELTGGNYARGAAARTGSGWTAASGTTAQTSNVSIITFNQATADWLTVVAFGICKSSTGSLSTDLMYWAPMTPTATIVNGNTPSFQAGVLVVQQSD